MKNKIVNHFYVKEEKKDDCGEAPIYLRITLNGERAEISTNRRVVPGLPFFIRNFCFEDKIILLRSISMVQLDNSKISLSVP
jgi:hypothetical protein